MLTLNEKVYYKTVIECVKVSSELPQSSPALFPKQFEVAATHLKPVVVEHPAEPHKQAVASLAMSPFLLMQSGADIHIQGWLVEQINKYVWVKIANKNCPRLHLNSSCVAQTN